MGLRILPRHQFAIIPDAAITLVERDYLCHLPFLDPAIFAAGFLMICWGLGALAPSPSKFYLCQHGGRENRKGR
jgi:hypothetical protein